MLVAVGLLEANGDDDLREELEYLALDTDKTWTTDDDFIAATRSILDGIVLAHAVTVDKRERNALGVVPDVVTLSFDVNDGLSCATGGRLMNESRDEREGTVTTWWDPGLARTRRHGCSGGPCATRPNRHPPSSRFARSARPPTGPSPRAATLRMPLERRGAAHSHVPPDFSMYRVFGDHLCNLQHALVVPPRRPSSEGTHRSGTTRSGGTLDPLDVRASARGQVGPLAREQLDC